MPMLESLLAGRQLWLQVIAVIPRMKRKQAMETGDGEKREREQNRESQCRYVSH